MAILVEIIRKNLCAHYGNPSRDATIIDHILNREYVDWQMISTAYAALGSIDWLHNTLTLRKPYTITSFPNYLMPVIELPETDSSPIPIEESWFLHALDSEIEEYNTHIPTVFIQENSKGYPGQTYYEEENIRDSEIDWLTSLFK